MNRTGLALALTVLLGTLLISGCTGSDPNAGLNERVPMEVHADSALNAKIDNLRAKGGSVPLSELTNFPWDTVYCFYEGTSAEKINGAVGAIVLKPGSYLLIAGALAVFARGGEVVKALAIRELTFDRSKFSSVVVVERGMKLVEPAASP